MRIEGRIGAHDPTIDKEDELWPMVNFWSIDGQLSP